MTPRLLAIGSAHLDVIARSYGDPSTIDQPGEVRIDVGGTASNIAINWAKMGADSSLLTGMGPGALANFVVSHLTRQNVETIVDFNPELNVGIFSAHLDAEGDMMGAISSMPIEHHHFDEELLKNMLEDCTLAMVDCNLSDNELSSVAFEAISCATPLYVAAVSEEKSLRMVNIRGLPALVALNEREARYFIEHIQHRSIQDPVDLAMAVAAFMKCDCLMTMEDQGVIYAPPDGIPGWERPDEDPMFGNRLGAGDGFLAAFIFACAKGAPPRLALPRAMRVATLIASKEQTNLGPSHSLDEALEEMNHISYLDPLTGLANRAGATAGLDQRLFKAEGALSVLLLDIDHFSLIYEEYGSDQADEVIREISSMIQDALREDDIAARWAGEEFVCFLPQTTLDHAMIIAERIRDTIEAADLLEEDDLTISIGVVERLSASEPLESIISRADQALQVAKSSGQNQVRTLSSDLGLDAD